MIKVKAVKTDRTIQYKAAPHPGVIANIPEGTEVMPATNLPEFNRIQWWVKDWPGMDETARSWARNYGFGIGDYDVELTLELDKFDDIDDDMTIVRIQRGWAYEGATLYDEDFYDDGSGKLYIMRSSMGVDGIVRATTREDAYQAAVDELLSDGDEDIPEDDQSHEYACWEEGNAFRSSGTSSNPKFKSHIAALDTNGQSLDLLTDKLIEDWSGWERIVITVTCPVPDVDDLAYDEFMEAYIKTALWSTTDHPQGEEPLDKNYSADDFDEDHKQKLIDEAEKFMRANRIDIGVFGDWMDAGHDLWLTQNGHGTGFWDGGWQEDAGERLTKAAKAIGERSIYVGDDGKLYVSAG